jgi:hypothetical protein
MECWWDYWNPIGSSGRLSSVCQLNHRWGPPSHAALQCKLDPTISDEIDKSFVYSLDVHLQGWVETVNSTSNRTQNMRTERLSFTNMFLVLKGCKKIFGPTRIEASKRKRTKIEFCPAWFAKLARLISLCWLGQSAQPLSAPPWRVLPGGIPVYQAKNKLQIGVTCLLISFVDLLRSCCNQRLCATCDPNRLQQLLNIFMHELL